MTFAIIMIFITLYLSALTIWLHTIQIKRLNKKVNDLEYKLTEKINDVDLRLKKIEHELIAKVDDNAFWCALDTTDDKFKKLDETVAELRKKIITESFETQKRVIQITRFLKKEKKEETDVQQEEAE